MRTGMMWLDGKHQGNLGTRIRRAASYYRDKYGSDPNLCVLHPRTAGEDPPASIEGMEIQVYPSVPPGHFWLGVEEQEVHGRRRVGAAA